MIFEYFVQKDKEYNYLHIIHYERELKQLSKNIK